MTICIQYARPLSGQGEGEIYGLDVAVSNFLSAWFHHGTAEKFICRPSNIPSFDHFKELARAAGHDPEQRVVGLDPRHPRHNLESISCIFRPDPLVADLLWRRRQLQGRGYAVCGLVHTMSGARIAHAVGEELFVAPGDGADALICPSEAIRDAVQNLWAIQADYLNFRGGGKLKCQIETPVIPLGIDTDKFVRLTGADKRAAQRQALGAKDDEIVILFIGRLSFATKAHPLALWEAAQRAARRTQKKLRVVMFGYFKPKDMEPHFRKLAAEIGKTAPIEFVMNDDPRFPDGLWAGADIFASLSDNIQESFGLTPIEAMASGLPAIVSDWDGYRGSVRDGIDGFLIPTYAPPVAAGMAISEAYYNEDNYGISLMGAAQSTAVDIEATARAIYLLAEDASKRKAFGEQGRTRAQHFFDWKHTIKAYEALWSELAQRRAAQPKQAAAPPEWQAAHPAYPNPFKMFGGFPSAVLKPQDRIRVVVGKDEVAALLTHEMNFFLPELLMPKASTQELVETVRRAGSPAIQDILDAFPLGEQACIWRCIGWMLKHGVAVVERG